MRGPEQAAHAAGALEGTAQIAAPDVRADGGVVRRVQFGDEGPDIVEEEKVRLNLPAAAVRAVLLPYSSTPIAVLENQYLPCA
jgi:hypothetical protein